MTKIDRGYEDFVGGKIVPLYGHSAHSPFLGRPFNVSGSEPFELPQPHDDPVPTGAGLVHQIQQ